MSLLILFSRSVQLRLRIGTAFPEIFEYSTLFSLPRSPCRSRLHDELVNSAQKNRRTRLRPPNMCQGQHRTMQQEHARGFLREALIQSARTDGERFFGKARYGKRRNTLCTRKGHAASVRRQSRQRLRNLSSFSYRWIDEKDLASAADD